MTGSGTVDCPICGHAAVQQWVPFCSKRCARVDLGKWLTGEYAISEEAPELRQEADGKDGSPDH